MSAEPRQVIDTEGWRQWENRVINDVFPLRRFLGASDHSAVFLTEYAAKNVADATIKFVPADTLQAKSQVAQWQAAAKHPHPRLVRLLAVGRCKSAGREYLFVVMEYAEQTLAEVLPHRPLNIEETQELLPPALDALTFLHRNRLVHGRLKPSNFMVVNDQLKLASDTLHTIGSFVGSGGRASPYDPPELKDHGTSPAGDIWSLGVTLVAALTQREASALPSGFPASFVDTVRRCLSVAPAHRPTAAKLAAHYKPAPPAPAQPIPEPKQQAPVQIAPPPSPPPPAAPPPPPASASVSAPTTKSPPPAPPRKASPAPQAVAKRNTLLPTIVVATLISLTAGIGWNLWNTRNMQAQTPVVPPAAPMSTVAVATPVEPAQLDSSALPEPVDPPAEQSSLAAEAAPVAVLQEVSPDVPQAVRDRIKGHIYVSLRVLVDPAGDVFGVLTEDAGPSKHFARLAGDAAREWKFVPADDQGARVWLLRFDFNRDGVATRATAI